MSDEISAGPEHVEKLLLALSFDADRNHCLREYIFDQTPRDYWEKLIVHFGVVHESKPRAPTDNLSAALRDLEESATSDPDLRRLLTDLAKVVGKRGQIVGREIEEITRSIHTEEQTVRDESAQLAHGILTPEKTSGAPITPPQRPPEVQEKHDGKKR